MINRAIIMGRITQDLQVKQTNNGSSVLRFNVAVDRPPNKQNGEKQADFITCVAWNQRADFISRYFSKGRMIALEGTIRTGSYDKNGTRIYTTEIWVDNVSFTGEPKPQGTYSANYGGGYPQQASAYPQQGSYMPQSGGYPQQDYGYPQQGGYSSQPGGYPSQDSGNFQSADSGAGKPQDNAPSNDALSIGNLNDFEEVISDNDSLPF